MTKLDSPQWRKLRPHILARDNHTCTYCGNEATEVDHIIPRAAGGTNDPSNLTAACKPCNSTKQDRMMARTNWYNRKWIERL